MLPFHIKSFLSPNQHTQHPQNTPRLIATGTVPLHPDTLSPQAPAPWDMQPNTHNVQSNVL